MWVPDRKAVILEARSHYFTGPDNGVFSHVLSFIPGEKRACYRRNICSPRKALHFREGICLRLQLPGSPKECDLRIGHSAQEFVSHPVAFPEVAGNDIIGEVIYIDHFGNAITNIKGDAMDSLGSRCAVEIINITSAGKVLCPGRADSLSCLVNSSGYLELFVNKGNACGKIRHKKRAVKLL